LIIKGSVFPTVEDGLDIRADKPVDHQYCGLPINIEDQLDLLQRYLLSHVALKTIARTEPAWDEVATTLESFGYLLVTRGVGIEFFRELLPFFEIGALAARMHGHKILHGDMHPDNFGLVGKGRELGERCLTFDPGDTWMSDRPLTPWECAQDLSILKSQTNFLQWEAAKLGYRFKAQDSATGVFRFLEVGYE
jgi:hypothetical protein